MMTNSVEWRFRVRAGAAVHCIHAASALRETPIQVVHSTRMFRRNRFIRERLTRHSTGVHT